MHDGPRSAQEARFTGIANFRDLCPSQKLLSPLMYVNKWHITPPGLLLHVCVHPMGGQWLLITSPTRISDETWWRERFLLRLTKPSPSMSSTSLLHGWVSPITPLGLRIFVRVPGSYNSIGHEVPVLADVSSGPYLCSVWGCISCSWRTLVFCLLSRCTKSNSF